MKYVISSLLREFSVREGEAGANYNAWLDMDSFSVDDAIVILTVFEMFSLLSALQNCVVTLPFY